MALNNLDPLDPDEEKDYAVNWNKEMTQYGDTIESSSWPVVQSGIEMLTHTFDETSTAIWIKVSSAVLGGDYILTNRIITAGGRTLDQTIIIRVRSR